MRKKVIGIRKVRDDYGWMGNMGVCELMYEGKKYILKETQKTIPSMKKLYQ